jgi:hypothetical protein
MNLERGFSIVGFALTMDACHLAADRPGDRPQSWPVNVFVRS